MFRATLLKEWVSDLFGGGQCSPAINDMEAGASDEEQNQQQQQKQSENLLLSFENPNYQFEKQLKSMDQARIDDHLNSNIEPNMYEELCKELKLYTELSGKKPSLFLGDL